MDAVSWMMYAVFNEHYGFLTEDLGYNRNVKFAKLFWERLHAEHAITDVYEYVIQFRLTLEEQE